MALTKEDLQAIEQIFDKKMDQKLEPMNARLDSMGTRLESMDTRLDSMDTRLDSMDTRLDSMQEDIEQIKEDTAITRAATNSLVEWADEVSVITQIKFPVVKRANNG